MTPPKAEDIPFHASISPKSTTKIRLTFSANIRRIYATWWDIVNTSVFLLFMLGCLVTLALFFASGSKITLLGMDIFTSERRVEIGLSILGLSISAGSGVALWLLNKGVERWSTISRIYYLHRYIFKALSHKNDNVAVSIFGSYNTLSDNHFEKISVCHPMVQKYYEELRIILLYDCEKLEIDHMRTEAAFRCFMISLMTKGFLKGSDFDETLIVACRDRAQAAHGIGTV